MDADLLALVAMGWEVRFIDDRESARALRVVAVEASPLPGQPRRFCDVYAMWEGDAPSFAVRELRRRIELNDSRAAAMRELERHPQGAGPYRPDDELERRVVGDVPRGRPTLDQVIDQVEAERIIDALGGR